MSNKEKPDVSKVDLKRYLRDLFHWQNGPLDNTKLYQQIRELKKKYREELEAFEKQNKTRKKLEELGEVLDDHERILKRLRDNVWDSLHTEGLTENTLQKLKALKDSIEELRLRLSGSITNFKRIK
jgi:succinate dehydrogenase/fumarate reductase flavoprotein subunit